MKTAMKIVSVLQLICGALMLVLGIVTSGMFAAASAESLATLSIVLFVLAGLADILCGVFGLRAAGDGAKATPAIVLGVIALIGGVLNIVMAPASTPWPPASFRSSTLSARSASRKTPSKRLKSQTTHPCLPCPALPRCGFFMPLTRTNCA